MAKLHWLGLDIGLEDYWSQQENAMRNPSCNENQ